MTTVATDGHSMAADGRSGQHGVLVRSQTRKLRRLSNGAIAGAAGDCAKIEAMFAWLDGPRNLDKFPTIGGDAEVLVLNPDGTVDLFEGSGGGFSERMELPMAVGHGMSLALGAMDAGASPERAIEIAIRRDPYTGGAITVEALEPSFREVLEQACRPEGSGIDKMYQGQRA